jgi:hypothetical protein
MCLRCSVQVCDPQIPLMHRINLGLHTSILIPIVPRFSLRPWARTERNSWVCEFLASRVVPRSAFSGFLWGQVSYFWASSGPYLFPSEATRSARREAANRSAHLRPQPPARRATMPPQHRSPARPILRSGMHPAVPHLSAARVIPCPLIVCPPATAQHASAAL